MLLNSDVLAWWDMFLRSTKALLVPSAPILLLLRYLICKERNQPCTSYTWACVFVCALPVMLLFTIYTVHSHFNGSAHYCHVSPPHVLLSQHNIIRCCWGGSRWILGWLQDRATLTVLLSSSGLLFSVTYPKCPSVVQLIFECQEISLLRQLWPYPVNFFLSHCLHWDNIGTCSPYK